MMNLLLFSEFIPYCVFPYFLCVELLISLYDHNKPSSTSSFMSSLAASRADNFYFPPEWRPEMGGISKFQGSKGANQYEKYGIIRFELPFDAWCLKCNQHLSKGLRFNAKKDRAGKYFSTTIYSFTTKCYACEQQFVIRTDPKNSTYEFTEGLRKHEQEYTPELEDGAIEVLDDETKQLIKVDPMFKLQHNQEAEIRVKTDKERLSDLQSLQEGARKDFDVNSLLRKRNRLIKKQEKGREEEARKLGLGIKLLDPNEQDLNESKKIKFKHELKDSFAIQEKIKLATVQSQSIFGGSTTIKAVKKQDKPLPHAMKTATPSSSSTKVSSQMIEKLITHQIKIDHFVAGEKEPNGIDPTSTVVVTINKPRSTKSSTVISHTITTDASCEHKEDDQPQPQPQESNLLSALFDYGDDDEEN